MVRIGCVGFVVLASAVACGGVAKDGTRGTTTLIDGGTGGADGSGGERASTAGSAGSPVTASGGSATGSGSMTGRGGTTGSITSGGATGSITSGGTPAVGTGGASNGDCKQRDDTVRIVLETRTSDGGPGSDLLDAGGWESKADVTLAGVVRHVESSQFVLDTCPPTEDCAPSLTVITIDAPELNLLASLGEGALVTVHYQAECFYGCHAYVVVTSLDTWGGLRNQHYPPTGRLYVAADEGGGIQGVPYKWAPVTLGYCGGPTELTCNNDPSQPPGSYAMEFGASTTADVPMGQSAVVVYASGGLLVHNVRSFVSGACDDYWNWAHWAIPEQLGD